MTRNDADSHGKTKNWLLNFPNLPGGGSGSIFPEGSLSYCAKRARAEHVCVGTRIRHSNNLRFNMFFVPPHSVSMCAVPKPQCDGPLQFPRVLFWTDQLNSCRDTLSSPVVDQPCNAEIVIPLDKLPSRKSRLQRHAFLKQCGILAFDGDATKNLNEHSATSFGKFRKKSLRQ